MCKRTSENLTPHPNRHTREGGYPVRRGLSAQAPPSLEYWIVRPSAQLRTRRTMTAEHIPAARIARALPTAPTFPGHLI
jgi:hypothetical protein